MQQVQAAIADALAKLPKPKDGKDGQAGCAGTKGDKGDKGDSGPKGDAGTVTVKFIDGAGKVIREVAGVKSGSVVPFQKTHFSVPSGKGVSE
jgi:hypothetical protein